jgi:hypothetical protein
VEQEKRQPLGDDSRKELLVHKIAVFCRTFYAPLYTSREKRLTLSISEFSGRLAVWNIAFSSFI